MRVGDEQIALAIDIHAGGPTSRMVGRIPGAEEISVRVEHLDPGGHVDDVQIIVPVDGDRAGLLKSPIGNSTAPPDKIQATGRVGRPRTAN